MAEREALLTLSGAGSGERSRMNRHQSTRRHGIPKWPRWSPLTVTRRTITHMSLGATPVSGSVNTADVGVASQPPGGT